MATTVTDFDPSIFKSVLARQRASDLIDQDKELRDEERKWLVHALGHPDIFIHAPALKDAFMGVLNRSGQTFKSLGNDGPASSASRFLDQASDYLDTALQSRIAAGYEVMKGFAESDYAKSRLIPIDKDLLKCALPLITNIPNGSDRLAVLFDIKNRYMLIGRDSNVGHPLLLKEVFSAFDGIPPEFVIALFIGFSHNITLFNVPRVYETPRRARIGTEWHAIIRELAHAMHPFVGAVIIKEGEEGEAMFSIDFKRDRMSRPPIFEYRVVKFIEGCEVLKEMVSLVKVVAAVDFDPDLAGRLSAACRRYDYRGGLSMRSSGKPWISINEVASSSAMEGFTKGSTIEFRAMGPTASHALNLTLDILEVERLSAAGTPSGPAAEESEPEGYVPWSGVPDLDFNLFAEGMGLTQAETVSSSPPEAAPLVEGEEAFLTAISHYLR